MNYYIIDKIDNTIFNDKLINLLYIKPNIDIINKTNQKIKPFLSVSISNKTDIYTDYDILPDENGEFYIIKLLDKSNCKYHIIPDDILSKYQNEKGMIKFLSEDEILSQKEYKEKLNYTTINKKDEKYKIFVIFLLVIIFLQFVYYVNIKY